MLWPCSMPEAWNATRNPASRRYLSPPDPHRIRNELVALGPCAVLLHLTLPMWWRRCRNLDRGAGDLEHEAHRERPHIVDAVLCLTHLAPLVARLLAATPSEAAQLATTPP